MFGGVHPRELKLPNSNSTEIFVHCIYPKFHHPMFTRSEVIVLSNTPTNAHENNKQILLKTSNVLHYTTTLVNNETKAWLKCCFMMPSSLEMAQTYATAAGARMF